MKALFEATVYRMRKSTGVKIAIGLLFAAAILYYVLAATIAAGKLDAASAGSVTGLGDSMMIWLFGSLVTGILVGSDFENKTIHGVIKFGRKKNNSKLHVCFCCSCTDYGFAIYAWLYHLYFFKSEHAGGRRYRDFYFYG